MNIRVLSGFALPLVTAVIAVGLTLAYISLRAPVYEASMLIGPTNDRNSGLGGLGRRGGLNVGGIDLGSIAGIAGLGGGNSQIPTLVEIIRTPELGDLLQQRYGILQELFSKQWDGASHQWITPAGAIATIRRSLASWGILPPWMPPTGRTYAQSMGKIFRDKEVRSTGLYYLSLTANTPDKAARLLNQIVREADALLRQKFLERQRIYVSYLADRLKVEQDLALKTALTTILLNEEQTLMLAESGLPFTADVLEAATPDPLPKRFSPPILILLAAAVGGLIGWSVPRVSLLRRRFRRTEMAT